MPLFVHFKMIQFTLCEFQLFKMEVGEVTAIRVDSLVNRHLLSSFPHPVIRQEYSPRT